MLSLGFIRVEDEQVGISEFSDGFRCEWGCSPSDVLDLGKIGSFV